MSSRFLASNNFNWYVHGKEKLQLLLIACTKYFLFEWNKCFKNNYRNGTSKKGLCIIVGWKLHNSIQSKYNLNYTSFWSENIFLNVQKSFLFIRLMYQMKIINNPWNWNSLRVFMNSYIIILHQHFIYSYFIKIVDETFINRKSIKLRSMALKKDLWKLYFFHLITIH